jgi:hypothetical protein
MQAFLDACSRAFCSAPPASASSAGQGSPVADQPPAGRMFWFEQDYVYVTLPPALNPLPEWNRYEWFRLLTQTVLGSASIPAFIIPLTIAGETVRLEYAGVGYAFLMSLSNVTDMFEGVVGAALYDLFSRVQAFGGSPLDLAHTADERTLILEMFVYISLLFTLLTLPFLYLLRRELERRGIAINLGRAET